MTPCRVLVTGGNGFVGRAVVEQLLARGDRVRTLVRRDCPDLAALGVELVRGDLRDAQAVSDACTNRDVVFHVAAKSGFWGPYSEYYEPNVRGTQNVLAACRTHRVRRLVFTSSPSVVFDGTDVRGADESLPYPAKPISHYSATKAIAEQAVLAANSDELRTIALRPHLVWGPRDNHMAPRFIAQQRAGKLRRIGKRDYLIDTTYIDDAARAHLLAADALNRNPRAAGRAFFISQGDPRSIWTIINGILAAADLPPVTRSVPLLLGRTAGAVLETVYKALRLKAEPPMTRFVANILTTDHYFNITAAQTELGYEPQVPIDEGLHRLAAWLRELGQNQRRRKRHASPGRR